MKDIVQLYWKFGRLYDVFIVILQYVDHFTDESTILIYNRVPKTGSTSFAGIAYELCYKNKYYVLHVNTTQNVHTLSIPDQVSCYSFFIKQLLFI